jgi:hypothetical protein
MPRAGAAILSDHPPEYRLEVACGKCERHGSYRVATLIARHGDVGLPRLLSLVAADCQRRIANRPYDQCGAFYPGREKA